MRLALLGGSFNPVHLGHIALAESVLKLLSYDKILFIPASVPPHKNSNHMASADDRLAMVKAAVEGKGHFLISDCEIRREGRSYTVDTLDYVYDHFDFEGKPGLIIGDDWLSGFSAWKDVDRILDKCDLIVARREEGETSFSYPCTFLDNPVVNVSSTEIRKILKHDWDSSALLPAPVAAYIKEHGLYNNK